MTVKDNPELTVQINSKMNDQNVLLISEIKIGDRCRKDVGDLTSLMKSIRELGMLHPVVVDSAKNLIAGYRRIRAAQKLGCTSVPIRYATLDDLMKGEVHENVERKDFLPLEIDAIRKHFEPEIKAEAEKQQEATQIKEGKAPLSVTENVGNRKKDRHAKETSNIVGSFVGKSGKTVEKIKAVAEAAEKEPDQYLDLAIEMNSEKRSVDSAFKELKKRQKPKTEFDPKVFNVWPFQGCDKEFGCDYKGRIPGQIVQNCLYFFVQNEDALIVDPMAGSGTTFDACKAMGFDNCLCYDINAEEINKLREANGKNPIVIQNNILNGLPVETAGAELVFLDPYYYDMITKFRSLSEFKDFLNHIAKTSKTTLKTNGKVALVMADFTRDSEFLYLRGIAYEIFKAYFGEPIAVVSIPMTTEQAEPQEIENAKKIRKLLGRDRTLFVFVNKEALNS